MTQTEQIVWHKYPDEIPPIRELYLVQQMLDEEYSFIDYCIYQDGEFRINGVLVDNNYVVAWANYPKGWQDDTD